MNAKIKFTCSFTIPGVDRKPGVEEARASFEEMFYEWLPVIIEDLIISDYAQEYFEDEN